MRTKFVCLLILLSVSINNCYSNSIICDTIKSGVEIQIKIIQKFENGKYKGIAVNTTIVNTTGKKVYIPKLGFFMLGLSIYKKTEGFFVNDKSLFASMYETNKGTMDNKEVLSNNPILQEYSKKASEYFEKKELLLIQECESKAKTKEECSMFNLKNYDAHNITQSDFLNPNESIEFLGVTVGLEKLENIKGDYKIDFDYKKSLKLVKAIKGFEFSPKFYHDTMGYELYPPENMTSNVVYITIL